MSKSVSKDAPRPQTVDLEIPRRQLRTVHSWPLGLNSTHDPLSTISNYASCSGLEGCTPLTQQAIRGAPEAFDIDAYKNAAKFFASDERDGQLFAALADRMSVGLARAAERRQRGSVLQDLVAADTVLRLVAEQLLGISLDCGDSCAADPPIEGLCGDVHEHSSIKRVNDLLNEEKARSDPLQATSF